MNVKVKLKPVEGAEGVYIATDPKGNEICRLFPWPLAVELGGKIVADAENLHPSFYFEYWERIKWITAHHDEKNLKWPKRSDIFKRYKGEVTEAADPIKDSFKELKKVVGAEAAKTSILFFTSGILPYFEFETPDDLKKAAASLRYEEVQARIAGEDTWLAFKKRREGLSASNANESGKERWEERG